VHTSRIWLTYYEHGFTFYRGYLYYIYLIKINLYKYFNYYSIVKLLFIRFNTIRGLHYLSNDSKRNFPLEKIIIILYIGTRNKLPNVTLKKLKNMYTSMYQMANAFANY